MKWITGSIRNKIMATFLAGLAVVLASALYGFGSGRAGLGEIDLINDTAVQAGFTVAHMESRFKVQVQEWKNVLLRGSDPKGLEKYWAGFVKEEQEVRAAGQAAIKLSNNVKVKALVVDFLAAHEEMGRKYRIGLDAFKSAGFAAAAGDAAVKGMDRAPTEILEQAVKASREGAETGMAAALKDTLHAFNVGVVLMLSLALATAIVAGWVLMRAVVRPVIDAERVATAIAGGDLTITVETGTHDEIGRLLGRLGEMQQHLNQTIGTIKTISDTVGSAAQEIAQGHADLSSRTEEQASSLEETAASMEEMTATVSQNAENAKKANQLVAGTSDIAQKGGNVVRKVVQSMDGISGSSKKIADIIGVIDGIAFQTNILALNAAVEAARAGEQGRGFAVVASEVRNLAQRSAAAAKEIKDLITDSAAKVDSGTREVAEAGKTMQEIVESVGQVSSLIAEISAASQEQAQSIAQVSDTVQQLEKVTQQNAAMVEEATAASSSLDQQAATLTRSVAIFKLAAAHHVAAATAVKPAAAAIRPASVIALPRKAPKQPAMLEQHGESAHAKPGRVARAAAGGNARVEGWEEF